MKALLFNLTITKLKLSLMIVIVLTVFSIVVNAQTTNCPGPWPTTGGVGQPGNWIVIDNTSNGNDGTGYGNVTYKYSYLDRFVRLNEYIAFLNAVDPGGTGAYVGNLVNFGMIQYSGSWQVAAFTSCSPATGQSMSAAQTGQIALTLISFNHCARFCNWLTSGSVSTGPYTFSSGAANATPTSVNINYPNSVRMPTENEFYKAAYYRASNGTYQDYGTQAANLSGGEPIVSGVNSIGDIAISNGHVYNQPFVWHPSYGGTIACLWQIRAGQGGQSYYNLYNMVGGFHHYLTEGGSSTTLVLRPQNQVQGGAPEQSRNFRLTGASPDEHYASPSLHLVYYGDACCPVAGTPTNLTVCDDNTTTINLFGQLADESTGGTWSRVSGTGGTFVAGTGMFTPAAGATTSTFRYTIAASGSCAISTADVTITIVNRILAGTGGTTTECTGSGTVVNLQTYLTGAGSGGTWTRLTGTGGTFNAASGTYTITSTATSSTFRYRVTNTAPCTTSDAVVTVNVSSAPSPGTGGNTNICNNSSAAISLGSIITGEDAGGTWTRASGTGGTFNAAAGTFTPDLGAPAGTHQFTYTVGGGSTGCPAASSQAFVVIYAQANAGSSGSVIECDGSNNTLTLTNIITGEETGGTWTRISGTGGVFTAGSGTFQVTAGATTSVFRYTMTGTPPCTNATSDATVTITASPTAGTGSSTSVCDNSVTPIMLNNLLSGEDAGGTWTRTGGTGGTFNPGAGTFTPAAGATTSTFNYQVGGGGCPLDNEVVTVNISPQVSAGTGGSTLECAGSDANITLFGFLTGAPSGGTWSRISGSGGTFNAGAGTFVTTSTATTSVFRYTVAGTAPCITSTADVTVNITSSPTAGSGSSTSVCDNSVTLIMLNNLLSGEDAGGTWTRISGTGGTFVAGTGTFTPAAGATTSTFTYTVGGSGCPVDTENVTVTITPQVEAGTGSSVTDCAGTNNSIDLFGLLTGEDTGGVWTRTTGTGGTFTAGTGTYVVTSTATTSTFRYTVPGTAPCLSDIADVTVNITGSPIAGTATNATVCDNSTTPINLFNLLSGEDAGGTWTRISGTGGTFVAGTGMFTPAAGATTSTFTYTVGGGGCPVDTENVTVTITPQAEAGTGSSVTDCAGTNNSIDLFGLLTGEDAGGVWTRLTGTGGTFTAASGTFVSTSTATTSTFRYTMTGTAPCLNDVADVTVNITAGPTAGTGTASLVCDDSTTPINLFSLLTGEDVGGTWTRTVGTGGTFVAGTGMFTPAAGATTSTFTYTVGGSGCPVDTENVTVNITPQANAGAPSSVSDCAGSNTSIDLFSLLAGEQSGGAWIRLTGSGGTFTAGSGTFVVTSTATTSTFRYTITGTAPCVNDIADVTVNIAAAPMAGTGSSVSICDNSSTVINLFDMLTGEDAGGTWTRTSGTGGTFVAATGSFTPALGATSSSFRYTNGGGGCPVDTEDVTVNITPRAYAGLDGTSEGCEGGGIVINLFDAITGEQTGGTWTRLTGTGGIFNAAAGTYALTTGASSSTFQYNVSGIAPCIDDSAMATVNVTGSCCVINSAALSNLICIDNSTPSLQTDNRIRFTMLVTNQNPLLNTYNVTVNGGTTITPSNGIYNVGAQYTLGIGTAGGGSSFIITIKDATIPGCESNVTITDPGNCSPGTGDCPPVKCGTATIQVNGN